HLKFSVMDRKEYLERNKKNRRTNLWVGIGAIVLIILLLVWLTIADLWGDTDVNMIMPFIR
ncbi:MAG: hypothetical protein K2L93_05495, partial [Muribaculaceae bacterium]|nr:hypothetical protein [Muribaculaceae bacterium]